MATQRPNARKGLAQGTLYEATLNNRGRTRLRLSKSSSTQIDVSASAHGVVVTFNLQEGSIERLVLRLTSGSPKSEETVFAVLDSIQGRLSSRPLVAAPAVPFSLPAPCTFPVSCPMEYCSATSRPLMLLPVLMVFTFSIVQAARGSVDQVRIDAVLTYNRHLKESRKTSEKVKCTGTPLVG